MKIQLLAPPKLTNFLALDTSRDERLKCRALQPVNHSQQLQLSTGIEDFPMSRRAIIRAAALLSVLARPPQQASAAEYVRMEIPAGKEVPDAIRQYWADAVAATAQQIDTDFKARLVVYGVTLNLPSGTPGDPAKDYQSRKSGGAKGRCGPFQSGSLTPYAFCPLPGETPDNELARECCRHFAFCVPYSKFGLAVEDRVSTVVVAPRLLALPPERWQAILAHELGHAADFHLFGSRFGLRNNKAVAATAELAAALRDIDEEADFEVRADQLGELLVLQPRGQKLCYDPILTLQTLTEPSMACDGDEGSGGGGLLRHYSHEALQGSRNRRWL